jgi:membrane protein DedA with SNARE-associated domain
LIFSKVFPGVRLFGSPFAGSAGYSFTSFVYLDLLGGLLWAGCLVLVGRVLGPQIPWAFTRCVWTFTFAPVAIFLVARLARRMINGPAEESYPLKSNAKPSVANIAGARETIV